MTTEVTHSASLAALGPALAKAQAKVKAALKDSTNPFFKSRYADLSSVWEACREALNSNGLSVTQFPGFEHSNGSAGVATVTTILLHATGEWIKGTAGAPVKTADAQGVGSAVTYLRRYALAAVAGVVQDDDDGEGAMSRGTKPQTPQAPPPPEKAEEVVVMPFGTKYKGAPIKDVPSDALIAAVKWARAAFPERYMAFIDQAEEILAGRGGE